MIQIKQEKTDTNASNLNSVSSGLNEEEFVDGVYKTMGNDTDIKPDTTELLRTPLPPSFTCSNSMQDDYFDNMSEEGIQSKQEFLTPKLEPVFYAEIINTIIDTEKRVDDFFIEGEEQKFRLQPPKVELDDSNNISIPQTRDVLPDEAISITQTPDTMIKRSPLCEGPCSPSSKSEEKLLYELTVGIKSVEEVSGCEQTQSSVNIDLSQTALSSNSTASIKNEECDLSFRSFETRLSPKVNPFVYLCKMPNDIVVIDKDDHGRLIRKTTIVSKAMSSPLCLFGESIRKTGAVNCNDSDHHPSDSALHPVRAEPFRLLKLKKEMTPPVIGVSVVDRLVLGCPELENDIADTCTSDSSLVPSSVSLASEPNVKDEDVAQRCTSEEHQSGLHVGDNDGVVLRHTRFEIQNVEEKNVDSNFEYNKCDDKYMTKTELKVHMTRQRQFECTVCHKKFTSKHNLKRHMRTNTGERPFECNVCNNKFTENCKLKLHMRTHTDERPFECNVCHKKFINKRSFRIHMRRHAGESQFQCNVCNKKCIQNSKLKLHMRTHTGERPFECNKCGKNFAQKSHLKSHMRIHTGEKPFECNECGKNYNNSNNLKLHIRNHTGERPFECNKCGKNFPHNNYLKIHMRKHTCERPFECNKCGKNFTQNGHLLRHMMTHTGERPFECNECGKRFTQKCHLKNHMRIHTGEGPFEFECNECGMNFTHNNNLKIHMRKHTGERPFE